MDTLSSLLRNVQLYDTQFYCLNANGEWSYSLNKQSAVLFYLVLEGGFYIDVLSEQRELHVGDIVMLTKAQSHTAYSLHYEGDYAKPIEALLESGKKIELTKGSRGRSTQIILIESKYDSDIASFLLATLPPVLPSFSETSKNGFEIIDIAKKVLDIASSGQGMGKDALINRMASIIMIDCLSAHIENLPDATGSWLVALKDPYLAKALTVMHNEPGANWTINKLAEVVGMSRSSFAERFKLIVGVPPLTYLIDYRMRLAARYLRSPYYSISKISGLVGYASDSTFSQAFKRVYGLSPRNYRSESLRLEQSSSTPSSPPPNTPPPKSAI